MFVGDILYCFWYLFLLLLIAFLVAYLVGGHGR